MSFSLVADREFGRFTEITPEYLEKNGITLLLADLDNTLAVRSSHSPTDEVRRWEASLRAAGIRLMVVSNNRSGERVENYCRALGVPYIGHAGKPGRRGIERAMALAGASAAETAMVGDRVTTDVLGAKRSGITAYIVRQIGGLKSPWHRFCYTLQLPFRLPARRRRREEAEKETKA
jgi:HAD superfamily phosphatase (TIGR01668 family)